LESKQLGLEDANMMKVEDRPVSSLLDLSGRKAVVTGAAAGLGFSIAKRLAEAGAEVLMVDINQSAVESAKHRLAKLGFKVQAWVTDMGKEEAVVALFQYVAASLGGVDVLVNNAGIFPVSNVVDMPMAELRRVLSVNLEGVFMACREAGRQMVSQGRGGVVVNISSMGALKPSFVGMSHYEASKGAVISLTRSMALELASHRIRVVAVAPGGILTEGVCANFNNVEGSQVDELLKTLAAKIPLGAFGHPDDIARVVLFLASDAAAYITGTTILVDGGAMLA
jgi:2-dehydro-3-deoxy-D-gluconate 5-dehydrogenase